MKEYEVLAAIFLSLEHHLSFYHFCFSKPFFFSSDLVNASVMINDIIKKYEKKEKH